MLTTIYLTSATGSLTLGALGLRRLSQAPSLPLRLTLITVLALPYDSLVLAAGRRVGEGPLLRALNWPRFLLHVLAVPPLVLAEALLARRAGVGWARHRAALPLAALVAGVTLAAGAAGELLTLDLAPHYHGDVLYYSHADRDGPPLGAVVFLVATVVYGGAIWAHARWPWVALAALYTLLVQAAPGAGLRGALVNTGEVLIVAALLRAERRFAAAPALRRAQGR